MADLKISQLTGATTPLAGTEVLPIVQSSSTKKVAVSDLTAGRAVTMGSAQAGTKTSASGATVSTVFTAGIASASGGVATAATLCNTVAAANNNEVQLTFTPASNYTGTGAIGVSIESIVNANSNLKFYTYNGGLTEVARFDSGGNLIPQIAGKGINFTANTNAPGMTSELLNWYEEGTWTPSQGVGLTVVGTFSSSGTYTRVGRQVTAIANLNATTSVTASAGGIACAGLPFSVSGVSVGSLTTNALTQSSSASAYLDRFYSASATTAATGLIITVTYFV